MVSHYRLTSSMRRMRALVFLVSALAFSVSQAASLWASDSLAGPGGTVAPAIYELDPSTGAVLRTISGFSAPGTYADALSFAPDGNSIYVLDSSTDSEVRRISLSGVVLSQFHVGLDAEGLTVLADGSLIIGGGVSNIVANVNPATGAVVSQFAVTRPIFGLASDGAGVLFGLTIGGLIDSYDLNGNFLGSVPTGVTGTTLGLAYTGTSFYVASVGSSITEVSLSGAFIRSFAGPGPFTEGLDYPEGVQVVPEPQASSLMLLGLLVLGGIARIRPAIGGS